MIMLRYFNRRTLAAAIVLVSGCAKSQHLVPSSDRSAWRQVRDADVLNAREAETPRILPETHFRAGQLFEAQGQYDQAIRQFRKAIATSHDFVAAHHQLGLALSRVGRHHEAVKSLVRATELRPDNAALRNSLGFEYMLLARWDVAETELRAAVAIEPNLTRANVNLGIVLARTGRFDEALDTFQQVLPDSDAYYNLGLILRGQGKHDQAAEAFTHVLELDPQFTAASAQLEQIAPFLTEPEPEAVTPVAVIEPTTTLTTTVTNEPSVETTTIGTIDASDGGSLAALDLGYSFTEEDATLTPCDDTAEPLDQTVDVVTAETAPYHDAATTAVETQPTETVQTVDKNTVATPTTPTVDTVTTTTEFAGDGWTLLDELIAQADTPCDDRPVTPADEPTTVVEARPQFAPTAFANGIRGVVAHQPTTLADLQRVLAVAGNEMACWDDMVADLNRSRTTLDMDQRVAMIELTPVSTVNWEMVLATTADECFDDLAMQRVEQSEFEGPQRDRVMSPTILRSPYQPQAE